MTGFLSVGIGGAVGAMLRYAISLIPCRHTFPLSTLIVNILGAVLIGYIAGFSEKCRVPQNMVLFLKTGLCGGFTTFSTFSLEAYTLLQNGNYGYAAVYVAMSVIGCIIGVWCGTLLAG